MQAGGIVTISANAQAWQGTTPGEIMPVSKRLWRLTADEFDKTLRPYLNGYRTENVEHLYEMLVNNVSQSALAERTGKSRATINQLVARAWKLYAAANIQRQTPLSKLVALAVEEKEKTAQKPEKAAVKGARCTSRHKKRGGC